MGSKGGYVKLICQATPKCFVVQGSLNKISVLFEEKRWTNSFKLMMNKIPIRTFDKLQKFNSFFISPQTSQYIGQHNEKNYIDGEKGHLQI
jgi:hypothetical protein